MMRTTLDCYDGDEDPPFEWVVQLPHATSTTWAWGWDGPAIEWSAAAGAGTILGWQEERQRGR